MSAEIADSDDESVIIVTTDSQSPPFQQPPTSSIEHDPLQDIAFDQFLSPTQRLSSFDAQNVLPSGTTSTDRFLDEVAPLSSSQSQPRIRLTLMSSGQTSMMAKKTYRKRSQPQADETEIHGEEHSNNERKRIKTYKHSRSTQPEVEEEALPAINDEMLPPAANIDVAQSTTRSIMQGGERFPSYTHGNVMRSSMGGYELKNYNFSAGTGIDFNPFGTLSQISLDGEPDPETEKVVSLFKNAAAKSAYSATALTTPTEKVLDSGIHDAPTFSQLTEDPNDPDQAVENGESGDKSQLRENPMKRIHQSLDPLPNQASLTSDTMHHEPGNNQVDCHSADELALDHPTQDRTSRAGTVDSISNTSEPSRPAVVKTKGRKAKQSKIQKAQETPKKQVSSDLGLENEAVIGLPAERYVPRPSKRRSQAVKPEPVIIKDDTDIESDKGEVDRETVVNPAARSKPYRGKKGKKGKAKQPNKSAIEHEEPQNEVPEDADDELLSMKGNLHINAQSVEANAKLESKANDKQQHPFEIQTPEHDDALDAPKMQISIDIPTLAKIEDESSITPVIAKKRGRKPKKSQVVEEAIIRQKQEDDVIEEHKKPQALAEKDPNVLSRSMTEVESPKLSAEAEVQLNPEDKAELPIKVTPKTELQSPKSTPSALLLNKHRIGLSRRYSIPSLLRKVDRNKDPPKISEKKEKLTKRQAEERERQKLEREDRIALGMDMDGESGVGEDGRGKDGFLVEWND